MYAICGLVVALVVEEDGKMRTDLVDSPWLRGLQLCCAYAVLGCGVILNRWGGRFALVECGDVTGDRETGKLLYGLMILWKKRFRYPGKLRCLIM